MKKAAVLFLTTVMLFAGCRSGETPAPQKKTEKQDNDIPIAKREERKIPSVQKPKPIPPRKVRVMDVTPGKVEKKLTFNAVTEAIRDVELKAQASGEIEKVTFDIGMFVRRGDLLAVIDPDPKKNAMDRAELNLKKAELTLELKKRIFERDKLLYEEKGISQEGFEVSENSFKQAELAIEQAQSNFDLAKINHNFCFVRAPFDGVVVDKPSQLGQYVTIGTPIVRIVDTNNLQTVIGLTYTDMLLHKKYNAKEVEIVLPDKKVVIGKIKGVAEAPDRTTSLYPMKIVYKSAKDDISQKKVLFPGMHLQVVLPVKTYEKSFEMDRNRLILKEGKYLLFSVDGKKAKKQEVAMLDDNGDKMIVRFVEKVGKTVSVVVSGHEALKDGNPVEILE